MTLQRCSTATCKSRVVSNVHRKQMVVSLMQTQKSVSCCHCHADIVQLCTSVSQYAQKLEMYIKEQVMMQFDCQVQVQCQGDWWSSSRHTCVALTSGRRIGRPCAAAAAAAGKSRSDMATPSCPVSIMLLLSSGMPPL